jgi:hypothetical protein
MFASFARVQRVIYFLFFNESQQFFSNKESVAGKEK